MRPKWTHWAVAVVAALGSGAAVHAQVPQKLPTKSTVDTVNTVTVQNNRKTSVAIYLEYGKFDRRLGVVPPLGMETLRLPDFATRGHEAVRLFAHPNGEINDLMSQAMWLKTPARLSFVIPAFGDMPPGSDETMKEVLPPEQIDEATITVENPRDVPCTILAAQGSFEARLGVVPAHGRETLQFPTSVLHGRALSIIVHPEGGLDLGTQRLTVKKGDHLGLRVPQH
ncbi:MAG: hypothetical protein U0164_22690 [Gemmatimonadaceae bacterium]